MRKMKTLFKRKFVDSRIVECLNEVEPECQWVLDGEGYATEKIDGTCCMVEDGKIYRRFDLKPGRKLPPNAIPCQEKADEITGHFPHWVLCTKEDGAAKYHLEAFEKQKDTLVNGTYELIGKHENANPYNLEDDVLEKHGIRILDGVERSYEGIKEYLRTHYIEGIVFYRGNGQMCKIKRSDFGFSWSNNREKKK